MVEDDEKWSDLGHISNTSLNIMPNFSYTLFYTLYHTFLFFCLIFLDFSNYNFFIEFYIELLIHRVNIYGHLLYTSATVVLFKKYLFYLFNIYFIVVSFLATFICICT